MKEMKEGMKEMKEVQIQVHVQMYIVWFLSVWCVR